MIKKRASWSKPKGLDGLIGRKTVDWSIFKYGTPIPCEFHEDFINANLGKSVARGEKQEIRLLIGNKVYFATLRNLDRKGVATETWHIRYDDLDDLKALLIRELSSSYEYIVKEREKKKAEGKHKKINVRVPKGQVEFLDFYETGVPFEYVVKIRAFN